MKGFKLELPDGMLTEAVIEELRAKMKSIADSIPEPRREAARKQTEELIDELREVGPALLSARTVLSMVRDCIKQLEELPRTVRAIAQALDVPGHIFELGGAACELIAAQAMLECAAVTLQGTLDCEHCKPEPASSKERPS
jgi:hypothetical protein